MVKVFSRNLITSLIPLKLFSKSYTSFLFYVPFSFKKKNKMYRVILEVFGDEFFIFC